MSLLLSSCSFWYSKIDIEKGEKTEVAKDCRIYGKYRDPDTKKLKIGYIDVKGDGEWLVGRRK